MRSFYSLVLFTAALRVDGGQLSGGVRPGDPGRRLVGPAAGEETALTYWLTDLLQWAVS